MLARRLPLVLVAGALLVVVAAQGGGGVVVQTAAHPEFGTHLVDGDGRALYTFTNDPASESICVDACAENWPPLLADGEVSVGRGVAANLVTSFARSDGRLQIAYGGRPLYTFVGDAQPGDVEGQGRNDVWYLVSNFGTAIVPRTPRAPASAVTAPATIEPMLLSQLMSEGAATYAQYCMACHADAGQGGAGGPPLAGAALGNDRTVLRQILRGSGHMPAFGHLLDDKSVAGVATFVRRTWGNNFNAIVPEEVGQYR